MITGADRGLVSIKLADWQILYQPGWTFLVINEKQISFAPREIRIFFAFLAPGASSASSGWQLARMSIPDAYCALEGNSQRDPSQVLAQTERSRLRECISRMNGKLRKLGLHIAPFGEDYVLHAILPLG
jgi:hypothetical protein